MRFSKKLALRALRFTRISVQRKTSSWLRFAVRTNSSGSGLRVSSTRSTEPADRIESLFEGLHERFASEGYYGCAFIRASVEFPEPAHPVHRVAREHKEMIRSYIRG